MALSSLRGNQVGAKAPPTSDQIKAATQQFEAILLRQFLAPAIEPLMSGGGEGATNSGGGVYGYMLTDTLATALAAGGGLGLAGMFEQQLAPASSNPKMKIL
jgi:flagellar protein FlgJ